MHGWAGQILRVDLTTGDIVKEPMDPTFARMFLGGRGLNSKILYDEFDSTVTDPDDPGNIVCIGTGPLSGTLAPGSGWATISVARSPVTGFAGNDNVEGHLSAELKYAGYDIIVVKGRSETSVYLHIHNDWVELRDAGHVLGGDVGEINDSLRVEVGDSAAQVFAVGPADESGSSTVLNSKNLKAIVMHGTRGVKIAHPEAFMAACEEYHKQCDNINAPDTPPSQNQDVVSDAMGLCKFAIAGQIGLERMALLLSTATGVEYDQQNLLECGERIYSLEQKLKSR
ncbi:MAG: hypothetical protein GY832_05925 [Chloroflexi bacterium]|nr:hypothetical protein [Chloroflexota bacterium]